MKILKENYLLPCLHEKMGWKQVFSVHPGSSLYEHSIL